MTKTGQQLRLSINQALINKNETGDVGLFADGFENTEITITQLAEHVRAGHAFTAQLKGRRNAGNFLASDVVSVDIDHGMTVKQALAHPLVAAHAGLIYTTPSHTAELPRFRIVFPLAATITCAGEMRAAARSLASQLGGDVGATDPARIYFGNRNAEVQTFPGRTLLPETQRELIAQSLRHPKRYRESQNVAIRSALRLAPELLVKLDTGQEIPFSKITGKARLHCPFHYDERASAFVVESRSGVRGIHCSTCDASFWPDDGPDDFDAFSFDEAVLRANKASKIHPSALETLFGHDGVANVTIVRDGVIDDLLRPGLTFVKAPKGAGKTEALRHAFPHVESALFMVHRRTLTRQACARLDIACYLDLRVLYPRKIGLCFDSILRLPANAKFKLLVIDEVEQVLAHILGPTIGSSADRDLLFNRFVQLLKAAECVVAMDADIGWASFVTLSRLVAAETNNPAQGDLFRRSPVRVVMNTSKPGEGKAIEVFKSKNQLLHELMSAMAEGKRVLVAANTKRFAEKIDTMIRQKFAGHRVLLLTADTAGGDEQRRFLEAPASLALQYNALVTSPVAGTGLDISFPGRAVMIDTVFGFCEADVLTHWDFDQHISRVRQPGALKVWLSPERLYYETHRDVVRSDLLNGILRSRVMLEGGFGPVPRIDDDALIEMAIMVETKKRWSKNQIKKRFLEHKRAQGFAVVEVEADETAKAGGNELLKIAGELGEKEYVRRVIEALPLGRIGVARIAEAMEAGATVSNEDWWRLQRARIETFYREPVNADLVGRDKRGRLRREIALFEGLLKILPTAGTSLPKSASVIHDREHMLEFMRMLLESTPLVNEGALDPQAVVSTEDLEEFRKLIEKNRATFEAQLNMQVRRDLGKKPMSQLQRILRLIGLKLELARTEKANGEKHYFYRIAPAALKLAREITQRRASVVPDVFLGQLHGDADRQDDEDAIAFFEGPDDQSA